MNRKDIEMVLLRASVAAFGLKVRVSDFPRAKEAFSKVLEGSSLPPMEFREARGPGGEVLMFILRGTSAP